MRSTSSFQSSGVCPALVISERAWQAVQALSTSDFSLPSGSVRPFCWPWANTAEDKIRIPNTDLLVIYASMKCQWVLYPGAMGPAQPRADMIDYICLENVVG